MCIIITQDPQKSPLLPEKLIQHCAQRNPDGHGLMYARGGKLHLQKQMHDIAGFYKKYQAAYALGNVLHLHFRIGTSGKKDLSNAHPHFVTQDIGLMHNGVLGRGDTRDSDTRLFIKEILRKLPESWFDNDAIMELLLEKIGNDKVILQRNDGIYWCLNSSKGVEDKDLKVWFSNYSYKGWNTNYALAKSKEKNAPQQWDKEKQCWVPMERSTVDEGWELYEPDSSRPESDRPTEWPYFYDQMLLCAQCIPFSAWLDEDTPVEDWKMTGEYTCDDCGRSLRYIPLDKTSNNKKVISIEDLRASAYA